MNKEKKQVTTLRMKESNLNILKKLAKKQKKTVTEIVEKQLEILFVKERLDKEIAILNKQDGKKFNESAFLQFAQRYGEISKYLISGIDIYINILNKFTEAKEKLDKKYLSAIKSKSAEFEKEFMVFIKNMK